MDDGASSTQWENHPRYGVVHTSGCATCSPFISHMIDAAFDNDSSFQAAREDLKRSVGSGSDRRVCDQVGNEGRSHNKLSDETQKEFQLLRAELRKSQDQCERLKDMLKNTQEGREEAAGFCASNSNGSGRTSPPYFDGDDFSIAAEDITNPSSPISWDALDDSFSSAAAHREKLKKPKTVKQMKALMFDAHQPGNEDALLMVQELCREAHDTSRESRMDFQKYLLSAWRRPVSLDEDDASLRYAPSGPDNPTFDAPAEEWRTYYEARPSSFELPRGVRRDSDGRPVLSDVKAFRIVARLGPAKSEENTDIRSRYKRLVMTLFFMPGLYARFTTRLGLTIPGTIAHAHIKRSLGVLAVNDIVRHYAACGITAHNADHELGPWARECFADVVRKGVTEDLERVLEALQI
ncbi:hypothetical protein FIBSPDRAFT_948690 [Athelia psychrophila]|uniref:Uncharacterized protein n=1 Tax=Athelia psychrophila TaxID=1759441 RepID=A0A166QQF1_9AGAM|nr:hypothetical protein FIBSPDRAFT_948690 [Fibularhizoctonia sp. CBS 109695]